MDSSIVLANAVLGGAFLLTFTCMYILFNEAKRNHRDICLKIDHLKDMMLMRFTNLENILELTDERIDVLDRLVSNVSDAKFNSKLVAEKKRNEPSMDNLKSVLNIHKGKVYNGGL